MNQRLRALRESLHLSRAAFGARLGLSGDSINNLERGRVELKDSTIKLICSEYRISEQWLRTGKGNADDTEFSIDTFAKNHGATDLELRIVKAFFSVDQDTRNVFLDKFQRFLAENEKPQAVPKTPAEMTESEIHAHALEIERQMLLEKRAAEGSSASTPDVKEA